MDNRKKITIIGAGLAGLTAAYKLQQKGYDVDVFEARHRVGGRVHSVYIQNFEGDYSLAELGGQNIADGGEDKHLPELVKELGLEIIDKSIPFSHLFYDGIQSYDVVYLLQKQGLTSKILLNKIKKLQRNTTSIQSILDNIFPKKSILHQFFTAQISGYEGLTTDKLSVYHNINTLSHCLQGGLSAAHHVIGNKKEIQHQTIKGGNALLAQALAKKIEHLYLGKILKEVHLTDENQFTLTFEDYQRVVCDQLILAIPCPTYADIIFGENVLSKERLNLIQQVQYGTNGKIMVPVTPQKNQYSSVVTATMGAFTNGVDDKILNMYFVGPSGTSLVENGERLFKEGCQAIKSGLERNVQEETLVVALDEQFGLYKAPVLKSWVQDPFAKGSYSGFGIQLGEKFAETTVYKGQLIKKIFEPVADRLFMIGEHTTTLEAIGTMKAAVESGIKIANLL